MRNKMNYNNPRQSGFAAGIEGVSRLDCPVDCRTHANARALWMEGWESALKFKEMGLTPEDL